MSSRVAAGPLDMTDSHVLHRPDADLAYDVDGPLPPRDGTRTLLMVGLPMSAPGFDDLAAEFPDRTVVRLDPRGLGRSVRHDGRTDQRPETQADDVHALITAVGGGPVDLFASSGGAVTALALVQRHPADVATLVAHEPPLIRLVPDADAARRAFRDVTDRYATHGFGAGIAAFIRYTSWSGEFVASFLDQPPADPSAFGLPTDDDGTRGDPLLSGGMDPTIEFVPDVEALLAAPTRVVAAVGEETGTTFTARTTQGLARLLGRDATVFPSHHDGFVGGGQWPGQPEAFARRLREVLAG